MKIIKDDEEHAIALEKILELLNLSKLDEELDVLVDAVVAYEVVRWPMGEDNEQYTE